MSLNAVKVKKPARVPNWTFVLSSRNLTLMTEAGLMSLPRRIHLSIVLTVCFGLLGFIKLVVFIVNTLENIETLVGSKSRCRRDFERVQIPDMQCKVDIDNGK